MRDGHYVRGTLGWLGPFAMLCGLGLVLGYSLLGASWLVRKCEDPIRECAYRLLPVLIGRARFSWVRFHRVTGHASRADAPVAGASPIR